MRADNTQHLITAAAQRSQATLARAEAGLQAIHDAKQPLTVAEFCRAAQVSRSWLYGQPALLHRLVHDRSAVTGRATTPPPGDRATDQSLLTRLQSAHQRNRELTTEITQLRAQIAVLYGRIREAEQRGGAHQTVAGQAPREGPPVAADSAS